MIVGAQILADRKGRRLSRTKYAELVGLPPGAIEALERDKRQAKPREVEILTPFLHEGGGNASVPGAPVVTPSPASAAPGTDVYLISDDDDDDDEDIAIVEPASHTATLNVDTLIKNAPEGLTTIPEGAHVYSNSEIQTFKDCRRKWYLAWYSGLAKPMPEVTGPRSVGTLVHLALEAHYPSDGQPRGDATARLEEVIIAEWQRLQEAIPPESWTEEMIEDFKKQAELCRAMISGYLEWLEESGADAELEILGSEQEMAIELASGIWLVGRIDTRVRRTSDGAHLFIDHKTVGELKTPQKTLQLDEQMMTYMLLEMLSAPEGEHVVGALYNMLRKVKRTGNAKPPFYDRVEVRHNPVEMESFRRRLLGTINDIETVSARLDEGGSHLEFAYPRPSRDCSWKCDFLAVCSMMDDGSPGVPEFINDVFVQINPLQRYSTLITEDD